MKRRNRLLPVVYEAVCDAESRRYIGATIRPLERRWKEHTQQATRGSKLPIHEAIRRLGTEAFRIGVIAQVATRKELLVLENAIITREGTFWPNGYNAAAYGPTGLKRASPHRIPIKPDLLPIQCRDAREGLQMTRTELATAGRMSAALLERFELGTSRPHHNTLKALRLVLEGKGAQFTPVKVE